MDSAAWHAAGTGRTIVTLPDLVYALGVGEVDAPGRSDLYEGLDPARRLLALAIAVPFLLRSNSRGRRIEPRRHVELAPDVLHVLKTSGDVADWARHRVLHIEHVLVATLAADGRAADLARLLSGWDGRQPEVVKELIGETQRNSQHVEQPMIQYLAPQAVDAIYAAFHVVTPDTGEQAPILLSET
jgi:hypothetical protein